jgi:hypothetical protein
LTFGAGLGILLCVTDGGGGGDSGRFRTVRDDWCESCDAYFGELVALAAEYVLLERDDDGGGGRAGESVCLVRLAWCWRRNGAGGQWHSLSSPPCRTKTGLRNTMRGSVARAATCRAG